MTLSSFVDGVFRLTKQSLMVSSRSSNLWEKILLKERTVKSKCVLERQLVVDTY